MNLQEHFNQPPEGVVTKLVNGIDIQFIPILKVKEMLSNDFSSWTTSDFKWEYIMRGNEFYISGCVSLNLEMVLPLDKKEVEEVSEFHRRNNFYDEVKVETKIEYWSFVGGATINLNDPNPTLEVNDNHVGSILSACIKNASKNIGRKYGSLLNVSEPYESNSEKKEAPPKTNTINKVVKGILKSQK